MDKLPVQTGENEEQANKIAELVYVFSEIHTYSFTVCVLAGQFFTEQGEELWSWASVQSVLYPL